MNDFDPCAECERFQESTGCMNDVENPNICFHSADYCYSCANWDMFWGKCLNPDSQYYDMTWEYSCDKWERMVSDG